VGPACFSVELAGAGALVFTQAACWLLAFRQPREDEAGPELAPAPGSPDARYLIWPELC